jgi:hypothetical protein
MELTYSWLSETSGFGQIGQGLVENGCFERVVETVSRNFQELNFDFWRLELNTWRKPSLS